METQFTKNTANDYSGNLTANPLPDPSAVSWGAILAGAVAAASLSLILLLLGTGLGLSSVSPWAHQGVSGTTFSVTTILWVTLTSLVASAVGGYIAGRLRARWLSTLNDEVYFRDTAHGFLAWAVATLATAILLTSVISSIVSVGAKAGASMVAGAAAASTAAVTTGMTATTNMETTKADSDHKPLPYFLDILFRKNVDALPNDVNAMSNNSAPQPLPPLGTTASKAEVARIYMNGITTGTLPVEDIKYAGKVIAQATNLNQSDAEKRVAETFKALQAKLYEAEMAARTAADQARKASAYGSLWLFIALLIGAFIASFSAIYGGRQRDLN